MNYVPRGRNNYLCSKHGLTGCLILTWYNEQGLIFSENIGFISQWTLLLSRYNESNDLSTFLCIPNNTICQTLQNTLLFPIQLLRSTQNAYHTAISWGLRTDNSRCWLGLQCAICEMVHCHHEKGFFFFKYGRFFLNSSTNLSNNAYPCAFQNNTSHNFLSGLLRFQTLWCAFFRFNPLFWPFAWFRSIVVDPYFIDRHKLTQKLFQIAVKIVQNSHQAADDYF